MATPVGRLKETFETGSTSDLLLAATQKAVANKEAPDPSVDVAAASDSVADTSPVDSSETKPSEMEVSSHTPPVSSTTGSGASASSEPNPSSSPPVINDEGFIVVSSPKRKRVKKHSKRQTKESVTSRSRSRSPTGRSGNSASPSK